MFVCDCVRCFDVFFELVWLYLLMFVYGLMCLLSNFFLFCFVFVFFFFCLFVFFFQAEDGIRDTEL